MAYRFRRLRSLVQMLYGGSRRAAAPDEIPVLTPADFLCPPACWLKVERVGRLKVATLLPAEICQEDMAELLAGHLLDLVEEDDQRQLVLNLAPVRLLSSAMLARLVRLRRQVQELGGRLAFCNTSPELGEILDLLGLPQLLSFSVEEDEAPRGPDPEGSLP
jgi:anti-anti-sigma factor